MLNYTTKIAVDQTVGEVTRLLAKAGAASVSTHFDDAGGADGLGFTLRTPHGLRTFDLHVNIDGTHAALTREAPTKARAARMTVAAFTARVQAERVAWRVVKDWLEAQVALIEAEMATLDQVMLPYLVVRDDGATLYEAYREREQTAIGGV